MAGIDALSRKIVQLRSRLRASWQRNSLGVDLALIYGACAGFAAHVTLAMVILPPRTFGGPTALPSLLAAPPAIASVLWVLCFVGGCPVGAIAGWWIGGFVHGMASMNRNLAAALMFVALFLPPAGLLEMVVLLRLGNGVGTSLTQIHLAELTVLCLIAAVFYRVVIGREHMPRG